MVPPWKFHMEPKNGGLEDDYSFHLSDSGFDVNFQGCMCVESLLKVTEENHPILDTTTG